MNPDNDQLTILDVSRTGDQLSFMWRGEIYRGLTVHDAATLAEFATKTFNEVKGVTELAERLRQMAVGPSLEVAIRQWVAATVEPTLLVRTEVAEDLALPWELLPSALGVANLFVARLPYGAQRPHRERTQALSLLIGAWGGPGGEEDSLRRELFALAPLGDRGCAVSYLFNPQPAEFAVALAEQAPLFLHLAAMSHEFLPSPATMRAGASRLPSVVSINTCYTGRILASQVSRDWECSVVSWAGLVSNDVAERFAAHLYQHLIEHVTLVDAARSFIGRFGVDSREDAPVLMLWLEDLQTASESPYTAPRAPNSTHEPSKRVPVSRTAPQRLRELASRARLPSGRARITSKVLPALCPALLKNGQSVFDSISVSVDEPRRFRLEILCDAGVGQSVYRRAIDVAVGVTRLELNDLQFPVLYQLLEQHRARRYVTFTVSLADEGSVLDEQTQSSLLLGSDEWIDRKDLWPYLPAFAQPQDRALARLQNLAHSSLTTLGSKEDSFDGYARGAEAALRQIKALYKQLGEMEIRYASPLGGRIWVPGAKEMALQRVRSPSDILEGQMGTCHDLSLLFAGFAERIDLLPLVVLMQGHTYFGMWSSPEDSAAYWERRHSERQADVGSEWMMGANDFRNQVTQGAIVPVEAEAATRGNTQGDFAAALKLGNGHVGSVHFQVAIDIARSRSVVQPL